VHGVDQVGIGGGQRAYVNLSAELVRPPGIHLRLVLV